jgi:hypothetical protein
VEDVEDIDRIYRDIDDDGNGTISMDEFAAWWFNDQSSGTAAKTVRPPTLCNSRLGNIHALNYLSLQKGLNKTNKNVLHRW